MARTSPFSLFFLVFIMALKTFHPSLSISESLICRAQDYFVDVVTAVSHRALSVTE